jgi:hypothetical protein
MPTKKQLSRSMESQFEYPQTRREDDPGYIKPKEPQPVPEEIAELRAEEYRRNHLSNYNTRVQENGKKDFKIGYLIAASEISTLQKTVERLATEKRELKEEVAVHEKTIEEQKKEIDGHANKFRELQGLIERYRKIEEYDSNKCGNHVYNEIMEHLAKNNL